MSRNRRLWTAAIFLSVATTGVMLQARGAVLPTIAAEFGAPEWQLGLVAPAGTLGYLAVLLVVGSGAGHLDARRFIILGLLGSALALVAMGLAPAFLVFLGAIAVRGAMTGFVRALDRPLLSHFYPTDRGRMYNLYDMTWAVGATLGPLVVAVAISRGSWRVAYFGIAALVVVSVTLFWRLDAPEVRTSEEPLTRERLRTLLGRPEILAMLVSLFFITGVEGTLFTWLPYYATAEMPDGVAEISLTVLLGTYIPGRLATGVLAERVGYLSLLAVLLSLLVPVSLVTFLLLEGLWILGGVAVIGLLVSGLFPLLLAYATEAVPEHSGPVNALASGMGSVGVGSVPALAGVLISRYDVATTMRLITVPLAVAAGVLVVAKVAERRRLGSVPDAVESDD